MFDTIGWGEIFVVILAGLIIIGPERLPGVIMDVRAAIFAARRAINSAKEELYGEEFDEFRKPMSTVTEYAAMGPKRAIAKVLFDEDGNYLDQFDPRRMMDGDPAVGRNSSAAAAASGASAASEGGASASASPGPASSSGSAPSFGTGASSPDVQGSGQRASRPRRRQPGMGVRAPQESQPGKSNPPSQSGGAGFSWADVT